MELTRAFWEEGGGKEGEGLGEAASRYFANDPLDAGPSFFGQTLTPCPPTRPFGANRVLSSFPRDMSQQHISRST